MLDSSPQFSQGFAKLAATHSKKASYGQTSVILTEDKCSPVGHKALFMR